MKRTIVYILVFSAALFCFTACSNTSEPSHISIELNSHSTDGTVSNSTDELYSYPTDGLASYFTDEPKLSDDDITVFEYPPLKNYVNFSGDERYSKLNIPKDIMDEWDTVTLLKTVLDYPALPEISAYTTYAGGFGGIRNKFNGVNELLNRSDCAEVVLEHYVCEELIEEPKSDDDFNHTIQLLCLEMMLAQKEIIERADDELKTKIFDAVINKNEERIKSPLLNNERTKIGELQ